MAAKQSTWGLLKEEATTFAFVVLLLRLDEAFAPAGLPPWHEWLKDAGWLFLQAQTTFFVLRVSVIRLLEATLVALFALLHRIRRERRG